MIHLGFTGTREGMTDAQAQALYDQLLSYATDLWTFHHGDCQGADAQAHRMAWRLGAIVHIHPPDTRTLRAYCAGPSRIVRYPPQSYLGRNRAIVEACDLLIAAPLSAHETLRSGSWATVRYARTLGKPVHILTPEQTTP